MSRLLALLVLVVGTATGARALICGDNTLDPLEQCDDGNLDNGDCCSALCLFEPDTVVCRVTAGLCDVEEHCTGTSGTCPTDARSPTGTVCREAQGDCDRHDTCDGT